MTDPVRLMPTKDLSEAEVVALRGLFDAAWSGKDASFSEDDWASASGGIHVLLEVAGSIRSHASVVDRLLQSEGRAMRTGYVEAVATLPEDQRHGHATTVMGVVGDLLDARYELGALDTGIASFYERFGWERWRGPTMVRTDRGVVGTPEEDGLVMVRRTPRTPATLDLDAPISCDWRPGDAW